MNLHQKPFRQKTLGNKAVSAVPHAFFCEGKTTQFGKNNHAHVRAGEPNLFGGFQSVHPGHAEIEKDKIGFIQGCQLHSVLAVTCCSYDLKTTGKFEVVTDGAQRGRRIVSNQNADFGGCVHPFTPGN